MAVNQSPLHARLESAAGERTYRHLAELTQTHAENVRRYMQGQSPNIEFVTRFCTALGISADWLLTGQGPMLASEIRGHALKSAPPTDLFGAVADQLEAMRSRIERVEVYVQTLETRVRADVGGNGTGGVMREVKDGSQGWDGRSTVDSKADRIAQAIAERPPAPAD